jgi:hypothetical protein
MMDHERQERDLQEVFDATQASYRAAIENTFALQEGTLQFARHLVDASAEDLQTQAEKIRTMLQTLIEESRKHREAIENLVGESTRVYESLPRNPLLPSPSPLQVRGSHGGTRSSAQRVIRGLSSENCILPRRSVNGVYGHSSGLTLWMVMLPYLRGWTLGLVSNVSFI